MSCKASAPESPPLTTKSWPTIRAASRKTSRLRGRNLRRLRVLNLLDARPPLLGARPPLAERADHDAASPVGGEKPALLHHKPGPGKPGQPQRGALARRVDPGVRQLEVGIVVEHRLQRFPELVALGEQETRALRVELAVGL